MNAIMMAMNAYNAENYVQFDDFMCSSSGYNPEMALVNKDYFEKSLSSEAKKAIQDILEMPDSWFANSVRDRGMSWYKVQKYMQENLNYRHKDTQKIKKEIKRWLQTQ